MRRVTPPQPSAARSPAEMLRERGIGHEIGFGRAPAVVVVDLMRAFTDPDELLGADLDAEVEHTRTLLDGARAGGVPVFFTAVGYEDPAGAGVWARKIPAQRTLVAGSRSVELDPRLGRREGEPLIWKPQVSGFFGTDLHERLAGLGVDTILLAGCTTSGCVRATAVDGLQHGYRVMVVREAVGDRLPAAHNQSLFDLGAKYADVVSVSEVLSYLGSLSPAAGRS